MDSNLFQFDVEFGGSTHLDSVNKPLQSAGYLQNEL